MGNDNINVTIENAKGNVNLPTLKVKDEAGTVWTLELTRRISNTDIYFAKDIVTRTYLGQLYNETLEKPKNAHVVISIPIELIRCNEMKVADYCGLDALLIVNDPE